VSDDDDLKKVRREIVFMDFTKNQLERYMRNILLCDVGVEGQEKMAKAKVLIVGLGGLGSPAALYLAAAGVGTLGLADGDKVDISNLQRQVIHFTKDINKEKVISAKEKINQLNPDIDVITYNQMVDRDNAAATVADYDFVIDGTDSFDAKFLINDACVKAKKPFSHAGVLRYEGQIFTYLPGFACYRCIFKNPPQADATPTCSQVGILGAVAGTIGTLQAVEALKFILGRGNLLTNRWLVFNAFAMSFREVHVKADSSCPVCGKNN
jgi:molybdopterin/thiamine biosynthesis adenylyltransferase